MSLPTYSICCFYDIIQAQGTVSRQILFKLEPPIQLPMKSDSYKGNSENSKPLLEGGEGIPVA